MPQAYAQLALSMILVGINVAVAKVLAETLSVPVILATRCVIATLALAPFVRWRWPPRAAFLNLFLQSLFGTVFYNAMLLAGVRRTSALEAGLVLAALPAAVSLGAWALLREPMPARRAAAAILAACGMGVLAWSRAHNGGAGDLLGGLFLALAVCAEASYALLAKANSGRLGVLEATFWMQLFGAVVMTPFAWGSSLPTIGQFPLLTFHALTTGVGAVVFWYAGLRRVPGGVAGIFTGLLPLTAGLCAVFWLGEPLTQGYLMAGLVMLLSMALATWPARGPARGSALASAPGSSALRPIPDAARYTPPPP